MTTPLALGGVGLTDGEGLGDGEGVGDTVGDGVGEGVGPGVELLCVFCGSLVTN